jgi:hypothetical protein
MKSQEFGSMVGALANEHGAKFKASVEQLATFKDFVSGSNQRRKWAFAPDGARQFRPNSAV